MDLPLEQLECQRSDFEPEALNHDDIQHYLQKINPRWQYHPESHTIEATFTYPEYLQLLAFVNAVAWIVQQQDHHPVITLEYNRCQVQFTTHSVSGISLKDFICAAKIDQLVE
jgi:4a-hydroxytetrahydrobiopterin dehydratase